MVTEFGPSTQNSVQIFISLLYYLGTHIVGVQSPPAQTESTLWFQKNAMSGKKLVWYGWKMVLKLDYFQIFWGREQDIHILYAVTQTWGSITNNKTIFHPY